MKSVEVEEVWVGQFGRKVPLDQWEQEFGHVLSLPMSPSIAFDMGWYEDKCSIYLFGISGGRGEVQIGRCALKAYIHPILSGFSQPDENRVWNTLELRFADKVPRGLKNCQRSGLGISLHLHVWFSTLRPRLKFLDGWKPRDGHRWHGLVFCFFC